MIPVEVSLKNFLGYDDNGGEGYRFDFRDHRLWSISGDNGAGKSAIFDVITYSLFGRHRGGASRDEELLRKGATEMSCSFSFEHNNRLYRITRTLKKRTRRSGLVAHERACQLDWYDPKAVAWREVPDTATVTTLEDHVHFVLLGFDYDTFISSVLLLQGDSDKLIRSAAKDRFNYLSGILDLRQYKKLEDWTLSKARTLRAQHELLASTLQDIGLPSKDDVDEAQARADAHETASIKAADRAHVAEAKLSRVLAFLEFATRRSELAQKVAKMIEAQAHASQIRADASEKGSLNNVLPRLRDARAALDNGELAAADALRAQKQASKIDLVKLAKAVTAAEGVHREARKKADANAEELQKRRDERRTHEPDLELARNLGELDSHIKGALKTIAVFLGETVDLPSLSARRDRLEALHRGRPLIRSYADLRGEEEALAASFGKHEPDAVVAEARNARANLETAIKKLRISVSGHDKELGRLQGELGIAQHDLSERVRAGAEGTCSHCGQRVPPEHIDLEISKGKAAVASLEKKVADAEQLMGVERKQLGEFDSEVPGCRDAEKDAQDRQTKLGKARTRLAELAGEDAIGELPEDCRKVLHGPAEQIGVGLELFYRELAERPGVIQRIEVLTTKVADLRSQQRLVKVWEAERDKVLARITTTRAAEVVLRVAKLDGEIAELEKTITDVGKAVDVSRAILDSARLEESEASKRTKELEAIAQIQLTAAEGHRATATTTLRGIDQAMLPPSKERIAQLVGRLKQLADADERLALLEAAESELEALRGRLSEIDDALAKIPETDRIPAADATAEREVAKQAANVAQGAARTAREHAVGLAKTRDERLGMQQQAEVLLASYRVWDRVAKLLGRGGLQLALMKRDLSEIEKLANVTLAKISGGNLRLSIECLRGRTGEEIVFRCIDGASADEALDVAFLSGGQKFRVAVALAVGIGQYAGLGGSMPSQIIDEGFGSLDDAGRIEMLDTIKDMSEHFERIILVSHTDSFHDPAMFPARYELRKDGRKTLVLASH